MVGYPRAHSSLWSIVTVVDGDDVGRFSSVAIDDEGTPHISFYDRMDETSGTVRYATGVGGTWVSEQVGVLGVVVLAFTGARRTTSNALHPNSAPLITFSDRSGAYVATRAPSGWEASTVTTADDFVLGQMVDLGIDQNGTPHLVTCSVTNESPLDGDIVYMTAGG